MGLREKTCVSAASILVATASWGAADSPIALPSGQSVTYIETVEEADTNTLRLRYLAPDIGAPLTRPSFEALTEDLEHLCAEFGLGAAKELGFDTPQIVVSLSAEPVVFGEISPDVTQVFEAFRVENGACMLEMF